MLGLDLRAEEKLMFVVVLFIAVLPLVIAAVLAVAIIAAVLAWYLARIARSLVRQRQDLDKSFYDLDALLKQRHDELPKLLGTCRSYMSNDQVPLEAVQEARSAYTRAKSSADKSDAEARVTASLEALFTSADRYPDLKANTSFRQIRRRLDDLDGKIEAQRSRFNHEVEVYNSALNQPRGRLVSRMKHLQSRQPF
jgi:LemA protein